MTRGWAVELAEHGIRVNAVAPGIIVTPLTLPTRQDPVRLDRILSRVPLARFGYPREVAAAAVFLLSDLATYVTSAILPIDGGSTCN